MENARHPFRSYAFDKIVINQHRGSKAAGPETFDLDHVTLEISNTTPLPARIYANEGICQVLFFEADADDVCEVSYKDKKGKYQKQTGVTLPKL